MQINAIEITNESKLIADYRNNKDSITQFFDYHPYDSYSERLEDLQSMDFNREQLADALHKMNHAWGADESTVKQIDALKGSDAVVIIGGQQAGLVTGPLYTINKIISIIQFARIQEKKLQVPVVPVFWIAGEDHDYDEINHVYMPNDLKMKKVKLNQYVAKNSSVSHIDLDKETVESWLKELCTYLQESEYTKDIYRIMMMNLKESVSFTDFFARLIFELFQGEGLVLVDSAHPALRQMEREHFVQIIKNQPGIGPGVAEAEKKLLDLDYSISLGTKESDGHLFYHVNNERILLERTQAGDWQGKDGLLLTTEQLIEIARTNPESLSNNVVTRPVMQELLFPTLAFVGGLGEISYWAALKPAFQALDLKVPPVVPRLSYSFVPRHIQKALDRTKIDLVQAINNGVAEERAAFIRSVYDPSIDALAEELQATIEKAHQPMQSVAKEIRADIHHMAEKNLFYLHREVDFLKKRMKLAIEEKHEQELTQFDLITMYLRPENGFQERTWNPLPFLNRYGLNWIKQCIMHPVSMREKHYVVYL